MARKQDIDHEQRHRDNYDSLRCIVAEFSFATGKLPDSSTVTDLMVWASNQAYRPDHLDLGIAGMAGNDSGRNGPVICAKP